MWVRKTHLPIGGHLTLLPMLIMMEKDDEKIQMLGPFSIPQNMITQYAES